MRILLCYDGFPHSRHALDEALKLAKETAAQITVFSVVPPDARATRTGGHVGLKPHAHEDVAVAHAYLREQGVESEMKIAHGEPVDEIVTEARDGVYDIIVVGSRGLGPIGSLLLGSVSQKVAHKATIPVLVAGESVSERLEPVAG